MTVPLELDTRLRAGEVITNREKFLLGIIGTLYDEDGWYLDQLPHSKRILREDFGVTWFDSEYEP